MKMKSDTLMKTSNGKGIPEEYKFDILKERPVQHFIFGYAQSRGLLYSAYVGFLFLVVSAILVQCGAAVVLLTEQKELMADALHNLFAFVFTILNLLTRRQHSEGILRASNLLLAGFDQYQEEELDKESRRILANGPIRIRTGMRNFSILMTVAVMSNLFVFTGIQALLTTEQEYESLVGTCNPYLPLCMVLPFSTRGFLGWCWGFLVNACAVILLYGIADCHMAIYHSNNMQLTVQLEFLNHSILHIFERAERVFKKAYPTSAPLSQLVDLPEYQACLCKCLKTNIQHHQFLMKCHSASKNFSGAALMIYTLVSAFGAGSRLYLCMQDLSIGKLITYAAVFSIEQNYGLFLCVYGQMLIKEGSRMFESVYAISWFHANKRFKKMLMIFMLKVMDPLKIKTPTFNIAATLETYGDLISAVYKASNLLRQSDQSSK